MDEKLIFVYSSLSSFVKTDLEILSKQFKIYRYQYKQSKSFVIHLFNQIRILIFLIKKIAHSEAVYVWFADYHSFLPILFAKVFRKKSFLVLGGYDVTYIPEYNYGSFNNPARAFCANFSIKYASINLAVSDNIKYDALKKVPTANIEILYTGYSETKFNYDPTKNYIRKGILSVCGANTLQRMKIKGVDLILETAAKMQNEIFILVGVNEKLLKSTYDVAENIKIIEEIPQEEVIELYKKSSVYLQLSVREGLPNSVCEAMMCGCIAVGTNAGGIPIAIGDTGFISSTRNPFDIANLIKRALKANENARQKARERIQTNFNLGIRISRLNNIIKKTL